MARRLFASCGITTRHAVINPLIENASSWSTDARMRRFLPEALPLATRAVSSAITDAGIDPGDVGLFAVASCTGYATPGLDSMVATATGMSSSVQRLAIGHMGCYAALPGLGAVSDFVDARRRPAVLLCVELTSLHLQPPTDDVEQMVAHALFSDAAAAVVMVPEGSPDTEFPRAEVIEVVARTDAVHSDLMTWTVTDMGFRMGLSSKIPDVLSRHVGPVIEDLLLRSELKIEDVAGWAVHPGGPRILEVAAEQLGLPAEALTASRKVLEQDGNCSSATLLMVLSELRSELDPTKENFVVAMAFGPGLTLYAALLRTTPSRAAQHRASVDF